MARSARVGAGARGVVTIDRNIKPMNKNSEVSSIVEKLTALENELCRCSREIREVYFANERCFDDLRLDFVRIGIDNPPYSCGSQGELSLSYDADKWKAMTNGKGQSFKAELCYAFVWFSLCKSIAERYGYGVGAAQRGFDVTKPIGVIWTRSTQILSVIRKMADIALHTNLN